MTTTKPDRRVQRTRQLLQAALLSLIREKGFERLTVQDVIDRANVGRATFYAHFENKEDLLLTGLDEFRSSIREHQRERLREAPGSGERGFLFAHELFAHVEAHRDVFRAMAGKRSGAMVQRLVQKIMIDLVREEVRAAGLREGDSSIPVEEVVQYIAGGLWGLLSWWVDAKTSQGAEAMAAAFRRLAVDTLKTAMHR